MATIRIIPQPCNDHITVEITHGQNVRTITTTKAKLKALNNNIDKDFELLFRNLIIFCRLSGASTWSELKTLIEAKNFQV